VDLAYIVRLDLDDFFFRVSFQDPPPKFFRVRRYESVLNCRTEHP
jgi:hypothetical protein